MTAETPTTPELRLSPDGKRIAWRFADGGWGWRDIAGPYFSSIATPDEVADWTPLVPAPATVDRDAPMLDPEELPPTVVRRLVGWLSDHGVAVVEDNPDDDDAVLVYNNLEALTELAEKLLGRGPVGVRVTAPAVPAADDQEQRVAEVLIDTYRELVNHPDEWQPGSWRAMARAAIAAMREVPRG